MRSHRLRDCYQIAVIGGNGFIGRSIISRLSAYPNLRIFSIDKKQGNAWIDTSKSKAIIQQINMDVSTAGSIQTWLSGSHVDVVIYTAGYENPPIGVWDNTLEDVQCIEGLLHTLKGLKNLNIESYEDKPYFIYVSSWSIYGSLLSDNTPLTENTKEFPSNSVGMAKLLGEDLVKRMCTKFGCSWSIVRPTEVFGKRYHKELNRSGYWSGYIPYLVDALIYKTKELKLWNTEHLVDLVHINYVSKAITYLIEHRLQGIFNIASGNPIRVYELFNLISDIYGENIDTKLTPNTDTDIDPMHISPSKIHALVPYEMSLYDLSNFLKAYIPIRRYEVAKNLAIEDILLEPLTLDTTTMGAREAYEARKQRRRVSYTKIKEIAGPEFFKLKLGAIQERTQELLPVGLTEQEIIEGSNKQREAEDLKKLIEQDAIVSEKFSIKSEKKKRKRSKNATS